MPSSSEWSLSFRLSNQNVVCILNVCWRAQIIQLLTLQIFPASCHIIRLRYEYFPGKLFSNSLASILTRRSKFHSYVEHMYRYGFVYLRQYSVWLWTGQPSNRGSITGRGKVFSSILCAQTASGVHPAFYSLGTGGLFPGIKRGRIVTLTTHSHLVRKSRMSRSYTSSPPKRLQWHIVGHIFR
jgi:hypothetical protein